MNIDLTAIINAAIALIAALVSYRLIPWIKARTDNEQQAKLAAAIRVAVFAAEQIFGAGHGAEKMDYALAYLRGKGLTIDPREVEAAVYQYLNINTFVDELMAETVNEPPDELPPEMVDDGK